MSPEPCSIPERIHIFRGINKHFVSIWFLSGKETTIEMLLFFLQTLNHTTDTFIVVTVIIISMNITSKHPVYNL